MSEADRVELVRRVRAKGSPAREVERARIVLLAAEGVPGRKIAARVLEVATERSPTPATTGTATRSS